MPKRYHLEIEGIVQGVGFRPFVYHLAAQHRLSGWVLNSAAGVQIEIEGAEADCQAFQQALPQAAPAASRIDRLQAREVEPLHDSGFAIRESVAGQRQTLISPDLGVCADCRRELLEPTDRRYRYPFINCTNCGPRFTIIESLPYDRPLTTMKAFPLCADCAAEYADPADRRFHAQPNACAACGPQLSFYTGAGEPVVGDPLTLAQEALAAGQILAVKGLGGYHLACDAHNNAAVTRLRERKYRWDKPFALMMRDLDTVERFCFVCEEERELLCSRRKPIVLLQRRGGPEQQELAAQVAPGMDRLGVMLPYTPLHLLLLEAQPLLVMTSANRSEEPIVYQDAEVFARLGGIAEAVLTHDRPIFRYCDDSVTVWAAGQARVTRRSRGYAPEPLRLPGAQAPILAVGGEQKNTFCLTRGEQAFLSQHIGDLDDAATFAGYAREIAYFETMFAVRPELIAHDLHPRYFSTQYAAERGLPAIGVQHHHAHLASVLAEHQLDGPAVGLIYDGTGYGPDGTLWGGEVLFGDCAQYQRLAHLLPLALPGGEQAIREPWRLALSVLLEAAPELVEDARWQWPEGWQVVRQSLIREINAPRSSGLGRLFDAVAALAGLGRTVNYEGQAAVLLEQQVERLSEGSRYRLEVLQGGEAEQLDWRPLVREVARDCLAGRPLPQTAGDFHQAVLEASCEAALRFARQLGVRKVVLSGGCWQNLWLLEQTTQALAAAGLNVYSNQQIPVNDGGLAYGQAAVAAARLARGLL